MSVQRCRIFCFKAASYSYIEMTLELRISGFYCDFISIHSLIILGAIYSPPLNLPLDHTC